MSGFRDRDLVPDVLKRAGTTDPEFAATYYGERWGRYNDQMGRIDEVLVNLERLEGALERLVQDDGTVIGSDEKDKFVALAVAASAMLLPALRDYQKVTIAKGEEADANRELAEKIAERQA